MDRLQIAIQKARRQRAELQARPETPAPADAAPAPASLPAAGNDRVDRDWEALFAPLDLTTRGLQRSRVIIVERSPSAAAHDLLRTRLLHQARNNKWRRIGLVSPTQGCGKTTTAANLAFAFSRQLDLRTMLLDFDLRRPSVAQALDQKISHGMEDVLLGRIDFADLGRRIGGNVVLGMNARPAEAPSELLQSRQAIAALDELERRLEPDIVLFDLPPMMSADDNFGFLVNLDAVLVVVEAERSTATEIEVSLRQIEELTQVAGIILNKCRYTRGVYGYDKDYYY